MSVGGRRGVLMETLAGWGEGWDIREGSNDQYKRAVGCGKGRMGVARFDLAETW